MGAGAGKWGGKVEVFPEGVSKPIGVGVGERVGWGMRAVGSAGARGRGSGDGDLFFNW